ncbi:hypothetical protein [Lysinibacillus sp. NPDC092081]|uniref:hypothetical protein n=1 Tax=Lysinibacillus sp. NPDC092081 TaxID=3364131 RepID=UPI003828068B
MLGIATEKDDDASGNTYDYSNRQQGSSSQQSNRNNIPMPTNAQEAGAITLSFGKHQGKHWGKYGVKICLIFSG